MKGKVSPRKGAKLTDEQKLNLRQHNLGKIISQETKDKISAAGQGKKRTEETKRKISESIKIFHKKRSKCSLQQVESL